MIGKFMRRRALVAAALAFVCFPALASAGGKKDDSVAVNGLTATLFGRTQPRGIVVVNANLALANKDDSDKVKAMLPLLHDRYLQILTQLASSTISLDRPINIPSLTLAMQQATDKVLGGRVAAVQITSAMTQRL